MPEWARVLKTPTAGALTLTASWRGHGSVTAMPFAGLQSGKTPCGSWFLLAYRSSRRPASDQLVKRRTTSTRIPSTTTASTPKKRIRETTAVGPSERPNT